MSQITFITGNGLDLRLGLDTRYIDFYKYIDKNKLHPENRIYKAIQGDPVTWANFEYQLGAYTRYIDDFKEAGRVSEAKVFHDELEQVTLDLARYLRTQDEKFEREKYMHGITRDTLLDGLSSGQKEQFIPYLNGGQQNGIGFVTLNYTSTLEKLIGSFKALSSDRTYFTEIHHIHGSLVEDMTLGVNDESQMSSVMMGSERDDLIKPRLIQSMKDGRISHTKEMLKKSSIVVLYGTSIGDTDKYIWEIVLDWLKNKVDRLLIIHKYSSSYTIESRTISRRKKLLNTEVEDLFLGKVEIAEEIKNELRERIFVIHNSDKLFRPRQ